MAFIDERAGLLGVAFGRVRELNRDTRIWSKEIIVVVMPRDEGDALTIACGEGAAVLPSRAACSAKLARFTPSAA